MLFLSDGVSFLKCSRKLQLLCKLYFCQIVTKGIDKAKKFYHDLFGLEMVLDNDGNIILTEGLGLENAVGNDFGVDERIFSAEEILPVAVVAEDKNQYGADAFEEYMKNDAVEADISVTETHSLDAPKAPKR